MKVEGGRPGLPSLISLRLLWTQSNTSTTTTGLDMSKCGLVSDPQSTEKGSSAFNFACLLLYKV